MKNFLVLFALCIGIPMLSFAQDPLLESAPEVIEQPVKFVIGLEGGYGVHQVEGPGVASIGLNLEMPFKRFSIGTGLVYKKMGSTKYMSYTGYSYDKKENEGITTISEYDRHEVELDYLSIPLRLQVRLPCNCVYVQAGVEVDFLKKDADRIYDTVQLEVAPDKYLEEDIVKDVNYSFVIGLGFKLHETNRLRIYMRPEYEFMMNPIKKSSSYHEAGVLNRFKFNMGVQYGI